MTCLFYDAGVREKRGGGTIVAKGEDLLTETSRVQKQRERNSVFKSTFQGRPLSQAFYLQISKSENKKSRIQSNTLV